MSWTLNGSGKFDIHSFYTILHGTSAVSSLGGVFGVLRLQGEFFVRTTSWGKILRCENLMKRGFTLAGWCCR